MSALNHVPLGNHMGALLSTLNHVCDARVMQLEITSPAKAPRQVAPGLFIYLPVIGKFTDMEIEGHRYNLHLELDMTEEGIKPVSVLFASHDESPALTSTTLRSIKLGALTQQVLVRSVQSGQIKMPSDYEIVIDSQGPVSELSDDEVKRIREQGPTDESLQWAANFYNLGQVLGLPPAKQVEVNLGLPRTTASKWVRRAREKGLLVDSISGKRTPEAIYTYSQDSSEPESDTDAAIELMKKLGFSEADYGNH